MNDQLEVVKEQILTERSAAAAGWEVDSETGRLPERKEFELQAIIKRSNEKNKELRKWLKQEM